MGFGRRMTVVGIRWRRTVVEFKASGGTDSGGLKTKNDSDGLQTDNDNGGRVM